jgi:pimeloyl-ACP methyl ester carboxylesterase
MRDYVHDVMQAITELPEPPVLIGHSMGSVVAQLVAERYPVRGLALLTPPSTRGAWRSLGMMARTRPAAALATVAGRTIPMDASVLFPGLPPEQAARLEAKLGRESWIVQYELLRPRDIARIDAPILVMGAQLDALVPAREVQMVAASHGVRPVWMRGMGHDVMLDAGNERALGILLDWVEDECMPASD